MSDADKLSDDEFMEKYMTEFEKRYANLGGPEHKKMTIQLAREKQSLIEDYKRQVKNEKWRYELFNSGETEKRIALEKMRREVKEEKKQKQKQIEEGYELPPRIMYFIDPRELVIDKNINDRGLSIFISDLIKKYPHLRDTALKNEFNPTFSTFIDIRSRLNPSKLDAADMEIDNLIKLLGVFNAFKAESIESITFDVFTKSAGEDATIQTVTLNLKELTEKMKQLTVETSSGDVLYDEQGTGNLNELIKGKHFFGIDGVNETVDSDGVVQCRKDLIYDKNTRFLFFNIKVKLENGNRVYLKMTKNEKKRLIPRPTMLKQLKGLFSKQISGGKKTRARRQCKSKRSKKSHRRK